MIHAAALLKKLSIPVPDEVDTSLYNKLLDNVSGKIRSIFDGYTKLSINIFQRKSFKCYVFFDDDEYVPSHSAVKATINKFEKHLNSRGYYIISYKQKNDWWDTYIVLHIGLFKQD